MSLMSTNCPNKLPSVQQGFTLIELILVVAIIGIIAAFGFPSYERSVQKSKRVDMMTEMGKIGNNIAKQKIAYRQYSKIPIASLKQSDYEYYDVTLTTPLTQNWVITATPKVGSRMDGDGELSLNIDGEKCIKKSGTTKVCGDSWKD